MLRIIGFILFLIFFQYGYTQRLITKNDALQLSLNNQRNLQAANLGVQQQQQLVRGAGSIQNPQLFVEASPYEPLVLGVQQTLSLPAVYRNRKQLQNERVGLARLQLSGSQYELKREVTLNYLQLQYFKERQKLFYYQDSIYQSIKLSSKRFFDAGQINKLEELQATTQADRIRNELLRVSGDVSAEMQILLFYTGYSDTFMVEQLQPYLIFPSADTLITNIQQQILQQQITIREKELLVERSQLLPQIQAGVMFPASNEYERPVGYQVGVTIPVWLRQNRSRIAAARTGIEITKSQQNLEQQRLIALYRQSFMNYQKENQSLTYYNNIALPQAQTIIETSQRLFQGGELNYIESLRNLQTAFNIFFDQLETLRAYNEAVIQLNYLNGTL